MATYDELLKDIQENYPGDSDNITYQRPGPQAEALQGVLGPFLAQYLGTQINPAEGGTNLFGQEYGAFTPETADQNALQQQAIQQALNQAGYGTATFGDQGQFTGIQGATATNPYGTTGVDEDGKPINATGVAAYQQFLNQAGLDANAASAAAAAGQGAGAAGIQQAQNLAEQMAAAAAAGQGAGSGALGQAGTQADLMAQAAAAGQGAGDSYLAAAQGFTGPQAYEQFMSPYQQEVIDATMADYQSELARQQSQLGLGAGNAFGGGRFGVAQGELGAQGARGLASTLAQLRQQGFGQANQLANQAYSQQMGMGSQAMQQALQNQGLYGSAMQGQLSQAGALQNQAAQNMGLYGQAGQAALGGAQAAQQQALQNMGLYGQSSAMQQGLAALSPQLAAQQMSMLDALGTQQQAINQANIDAGIQGNQMTAMMPQQQLGFFGQMLPTFTGQTIYGPTTPETGAPSGMSQLLGGLAGIGGVAGTLGGIFGYG